MSLLFGLWLCFLDNIGWISQIVCGLDILGLRVSSHYPGSLCLPTFQIFKYPRSSSILAFQVSQYPPNLLILPPFKSLQSAVCGLLGIIPRPSILTTHPYYNADFDILVEIEYARPVPKIIVSTIKIYEWAYKGICLYFWDNQRESNKHICSQND